MKIGVYVGSFNPVHVGHIKIVQYLLSNKYLDKVIIVPTGNYWNKNNLVDIKHRINMLKFYEKGNIIIDTVNNFCEYTYQVLDNLSKNYKKDNLYLIIGADNIINFNQWVNYKELLSYNLIIVNRDNIDVSLYLKKLNKCDNYIILNDLPIINISSTIIRENIKNENYNNLDNVIDNVVLEYINKNNLYK